MAAETKKKLKVGLVLDDGLDSNDGVQQYVKAIGAWLVSQGHEVRYLVGQTVLDEWAGGKVYSLSRNVRVKFNKNRLTIPRPASKKRIKEVLDREQFDVLHVQMPHSPFMAHKVVNMAPKNTAVIGTFHILPAGRLQAAASRLLRRWYGKGLKRFDRIVSVSPAAAEFAKRVFHIQSEVVPNMVDIQRFEISQKTSPEHSGKHIVFLGRLVQRKGPYHLLKAFRLLQQGMPDTHLTIAGGGPDRTKLEKYVRRYQLEDAVTFAGFIDEGDKPGLLRSADIACFPSLYGESFGIVLIEAMAAGTGVVLGGNNPGYCSVLGDQPTLLIDPKDTAAFAKRLEMLLSDNILKKQLHGWQLEHVKRYDVPVVGKQLVGLYRQAIAKRLKNEHNDTHEF